MIIQPSLPPNTIVPEEDSLFIPYLNRLYEDIAFTVNNKDNTFFQIPISSTASNIPNLPNFGAFVVCISGSDSTLPTITASLCKSSAIGAGSIAVLGSQVGTAAWAGNSLTITSTATNFQIAHNRAGVNANFNIRILGTQD
jgi:hypothetical protein